MKILILNGSPKKNSDTMHLTNAFINGLNKNNHDIGLINVIEKNINPCTGCFICWKNLDGKCIQKDDQNEILNKIKNADLIIWSFPLYFYGMPSHLKAVLDRIISLSKMSMKETNGIVVHDTLIDFSKKKYIVICGCGFPNWQGNFEPVKIQAKNLFGNNLITICVPETPMLNQPTAKPLTEPLLEKFTFAGETYDKKLTLSKELIDQLEYPMIPNEIYIQIVNSQQ